MPTTATGVLTTYHWRLFAVCFLACVFAGLISTLMPVYLPVVMADLARHQSESDQHHWAAFINAVFVFGAATGGLLAGWICDRYGRKKGIVFSILAYAVPALLTAAMNDWIAVFICRFISGWGMGAVLVTTATMLMEEWPASSRSVYMGLLSVAIPVGIFSAGAIDYWISAWRIAFLVSILPLILVVVAIRWVKESESWKEKIYSEEENNDAQTEMWQPYRMKLLAGAVIFGSMLIGLWAIFLWMPSWIQELAAATEAQQARGISMMLLGCGGIAGGICSGWLVRITTIRNSLFMCFVICIIMAGLLFTSHDDISIRLYTEILILALAFGVSQGLLTLYIPALFPVAIRGRATGFCFNAGRLLTAVAVLFVGVLVKVLGGYNGSLLCFSIVFVIGGIATWMTRTSSMAGMNESVR